MLTEFETLKREILSCRTCRPRFGFEPHPIVFGHKHSRIMQISQAPSANVHITRKPFDDASGRKLRREWYQITDEVFYNPENFYITSIAHCFPGKLANGGDRLPPLACANKWLVQEMECVDSRIVILLGGRAASFFFPDRDYSSLVFYNHRIGNKITYVLPHPSPLNAKWFKDNPWFVDGRLQEIRAAVHEVLK